MSCLVLNAGSSSVKFALYTHDTEPLRTFHGQVSGIGTDAHLKLRRSDGTVLEDRDVDDGAVADPGAALGTILDALAPHVEEAPRVVGHRIVHGGLRHTGPAILDEAVLEELAALVPFAPLHQPHNLAGVAAARKRFPHALQIGCFDTAFHRDHDFVNDAFALPRSLYERGVRRFGFHGLSYDYVTGRLKEIAPFHHEGGVVIAHLGNGASMCALRGGHSVGSTMGFTALDGLPMGTRCGQLDPGVVLYLMDALGMDHRKIEQMLYRDSGLKGLSGVSSDMRVLLASQDPHAAQAIDYYVFRIRREIGAMAAILGGLDAVVFTGGIGENAFQIRERILDDMDWLGLELDETRNRQSRTVISSDRSRVRLFVVPTNEELVIARAAFAALG